MPDFEIKRTETFMLACPWGDVGLTWDQLTDLYDLLGRTIDEVKRDPRE